MSLADLWSRTLVYFGIAEEDEDFYEADETYGAEETMEQIYKRRNIALCLQSVDMDSNSPVVM